MNITVVGGDQACRMIFDGNMTCKFAREIEDRIIDTMRRHPRLDVDLSRVREIDLCGIHLLGVLQGMGGSEVNIVATSPVVDQASRHLLASRRGSSLARATRNGNGAAAHP